VELPAFLRRSPNNECLGVQVRNHGPVNYLGAESLERSIDLPREDFKQVLVIVAIAAAISIAALFAYNYTVFADHQETVAQIEEIINRDVTLDLPAMRDYAGRSNDDIIGSFNAAGYTLYDNTSEEDRNAGGFDMYKLASDVTTEEAAAAYSQGLDKIDPGEAAKVLSGSWRFLVDRTNGNEMRLRYIDFAATTPTTALNDAVAAQAFDAAQASAPTEDSLGNTNVTGTFEKDGKTYNYTISVCDLSQVYDIPGLPATTQYVGIRVTG
jgi:hypothetical protein